MGWEPRVALKDGLVSTITCFNQLLSNENCVRNCSRSRPHKTRCMQRKSSVTETNAPFGPPTPLPPLEASSKALDSWLSGLVGMLIVDEDGVYDPRHPNDRLLLGMKGTMSEMELWSFASGHWKR